MTGQLWVIDAVCVRVQQAVEEQDKLQTEVAHYTRVASWRDRSS